VEVFGAFSGAEQTAFEASLAPFEQQSGIDVEYVGSTNFTELIRSRVQGDNAPDIAIFPQPGLLLDVSTLGGMAPLNDVLDVGALQETLVPGLLEATEGEDGNFYGVPMRMAVKSVVWTPSPQFGEAGYTAPTTHEQLLGLTQQIAGSGTPPWCFGMESGQATGWVATDWLEEYVLRIGGPEFYDQWARHEVPFNHPTVIEAGRVVEQLLLTDQNVLGGRASIVSTPFGTAGNPMFNTPPECYMMRQGNFITSGDFFPTEVTANLDTRTDIFQLPRPIRTARPASVRCSSVATSRRPSTPRTPRSCRSSSSWRRTSSGPSGRRPVAGSRRTPPSTRATTRTRPPAPSPGSPPPPRRPPSTVPTSCRVPWARAASGAA
ncbi:MAG TPA: ABC transporter substrate-binding protein, partial [Pseudonocardia sp.]|nr:ABC transporter substrate-binding protein [Pseudonocardia sp.]